MAKKKLNKRVIILLVALGVLVLMGAGALILKKLPRDPAEFARRSDAALAEKDYRHAEEYLGVAIQNAKRDPKYLYKMAKLQLELVLKAPNLTQSERVQRYNNALGCLQNALRADPRHLDSQKLLADLRWQEAVGYRRWTQYIEEADKLLKIDPKDDQTYYRRATAKAAMASTMQGEYTNDAIVDYQKAIELKPNEASYYLDLATFYKQIEKAKEANKTLEEGIKANPNDATLRAQYAASLFALNRKVEAFAQLKEAIARQPKDATGLLMRAGLYAQEKKTNEALADLEAAKKADPSNAQTYVQIASMYMGMRQPEKGQKALREGLESLSRSAETRPAGEVQLQDPETRRKEIARLEARLQLSYMLASIDLDLITENPKTKDKDALLKEARECRDTLQRMAPDNYSLPEIAGRIAFINGDNEEAMKQLEASYEKSGRVGTAGSFALINLYLMNNLPGKADKLLEQFLRYPQFQKNPAFWVLKANLQIRFREYDNANRCIAQALMADPGNAQAKNLRLLLTVLNTDQTVPLPPDLDLNQQVIIALLDRASILWKEQKRPQALSLLSQLNQRIPGDISVAMPLAAYYMVDKQEQKARNVMAVAQSKNPDNPRVKFLAEQIAEPDPEKRFQLALKNVDEMTKDPLKQALEKADICATYGKSKESLEYLKKASEINPDEPDVVRKLFQYSLQEKDWKLAQDCVTKATKSNLDRTGGKLMNAQLTFFQEKYPEALAQTVDLVKSYPDLKEGKILLADCYLRNKEPNKAYETLRAIDANDPGYAPAVVGLAKVCELLGKFDEQAEYIERAYKLVPNNEYVQERFLSRQEERAADPSVMIQQREQRLKQDPNNLDNRLRLGMLYERNKQLDKAEEQYVYLYQKAPDRLMAATYLGSFYLRTNRASEVDKLMAELLKAMPERRVDIYSTYGEFLEVSSPEQAEAAFFKAIDADKKDPRGHLSLARFYARRNDWKKAADAMQQVVDLSPDNMAYEKELARDQISANQMDEATKRLDRILSKLPGDTEALTLKAIIARQKGDNATAMGLLDEAVKSNPENPLPFRNRARLYMSQGDFEKAKDDLQKARELSGAPDVAVELAQVYMRLRDNPRAETLLKEVVTRYPDNVPAMRQLIGLYMTDKRWSLLEQTLKDGQKRFPNDPAYLMLEAQMWQMRNDTDRRLTAMEAGIHLSPNATPVILLYFNAMLETGRFERLLSAADSYSKDQALAPWPAIYRATALGKLKKYAEADAMFQKMSTSLLMQYMDPLARMIEQAYGLTDATARLETWAKAEPKAWQLQFILGRLYAHKGDTKKSLDAFLLGRELATQPGQKALVNRELGNAYYNMKQYPEAEKTFLAVLEIYPNDPQVLNNLGYMYAEDMNQPDKALPLVQKALEIYPNDQNVLDTYGWALFKQGKYNQAEEFLNRATSAGDTTPIIILHLATLKEQTGSNSEALKLYQQGFEMVRDDKNSTLYNQLKQGADRTENKLRSQK